MSSLAVKSIGLGDFDSEWNSHCIYYLVYVACGQHLSTDHVIPYQYRLLLYRWASSDKIMIKPLKN